MTGRTSRMSTSAIAADAVESMAGSVGNGLCQALPPRTIQHRGDGERRRPSAREALCNRRAARLRKQAERVGMAMRAFVLHGAFPET